MGSLGKAAKWILGSVVVLAVVVLGSWLVVSWISRPAQADPVMTLVLAGAVLAVLAAGLFALRINKDFERSGFIVISVLAFVGLLAVFIFGAQADPTKRGSVISTLLILAGAAALSGGLLGFLFGIPRAGSTVQNANYNPNTNLEQISDWVTKILVGVTLVQLKEIPGLVHSLLNFLEPGLGRTDASGKVFALGLLLFFSIGGFLVSYIAIRRYPGSVGLPA